MTQQFYNPFEDRVVQQTIDDVLEAGDKQDSLLELVRLVLVPLVAVGLG